jgi:triacylglycerol lipase
MKRMSLTSRVAGLGVVLMIAAFVLAAPSGATTEPSGTPSGKVPVIFVHGFEESGSMWNTAISYFEAHGYTSGDITNFTYDSTKAASAISPQLGTEVDKLLKYTGKSKVDIVSHSFGSMVTRYCMELGTCKGKVNHWMSMAGADNGTSIANYCTYDASCRDMNGSTSTISTLKSNYGQLASQGIKVEVQWTPNDGVIIPATNSQEASPATNVQVSSSLTHLTIYSNSAVIQETVSFFTR